MKYLIAVLLLCGVMVGQGKVKTCAFGLKSKVILDTRPIKPEPKYQMFPQLPPTINIDDPPYSRPMRTVCPYERAIELFGEDRVTFEELTVAGVTNTDFRKPVKREEERCLVDGSLAIKTHCIYKQKRVLVDGKAVYEENGTSSSQE